MVASIVKQSKSSIVERNKLQFHACLKNKVIVKGRKISWLSVSPWRIECSTFFWQRVAKLSSGLFPPAFVITINMFMNGANVMIFL